ncbi:MAG: transglutaminase domain-containing protein [Nitrosomonadaceae bacterium]|nr:transglutaminase domain-containing protein [Nitrosomonadaceae bacterium]
MKRRAFMQAALATPFIAGLPALRFAVAAPKGEDWRTFELSTKLEITNPSGASRAWVPLPYTAKTSWHKPLSNTWTGNGRMSVITEPKYCMEMLYVEWQKNEKAPVLEVISRFATRNRAVDFSKPNPNAISLSQAEMTLYTEPTELIPTDGIVRETAHDIIRHARTDIEKAHAIYAARDIYGIRVAPSQLGYKSLGLGSANASKGQHCRAEFFAQGIGWVPVDPADVRKVVLEEPPGNLPINDPKVVAMRKKLFGAWEMNWLAYNTAHDVTLPNSRTKIAYFMYPNGETGGKVLNQLDPDTFKYTITTQQY